MAYSALTDIEKLIPEETVIQLTDDEGTGEVVQDPVTEAIAKADSEIDAYLAAQYDVPLSPVPALIRNLSTDIAIYNLYSRRVEEIPQTRAERYKNAIRILEKISKGEISLGTGDPGVSASADESAEISKTEEDRIFTRTKLEGF